MWRARWSSSAAPSVTIAMSFDVAAPPPRADRDLRRDGRAARARSEPFRRRDRIAPRRRGLARVPTEHAYADGNYRIIGVADMAHAIRAESAASRQRRARLPRAGSDGGVPALVRSGAAVDDREPAGAAGHAAVDIAARRTRLRRERAGVDNERRIRHARGTDRLGRLERARAGEGRPHRRRHARRRKASRSMSRTRPRPSPIRRSPT